MNISDQSDLVIGRSLGAAAWNYDILLPDGSYTTFVEGTRITGIATIAGSGSNRILREKKRLSARYGGKEDAWSKMAGNGIVNDLGLSRKAHVHWYQICFESGFILRVEFKLKRFYN